MTESRRGVLYALVVVLLWSTMGTASKLAVATLDSFVATVYIGFFATLMLFGYLVIKGKAGRIVADFRVQPLFYLITGAIGFGLQQVLYMRAYALQPASITVVVYYLYPLLMVALAAILFRERTSGASVLLILAGFAGVYVLASNGRLTQIHLTAGVALAFLAALGWALFSVIVKHRRFDIDTGMFLFSLSGELFLVALIPWQGFTFSITPAQGAILVYLAACPTALGFVLWNRALHLTCTSLCANIALLTPLISTGLIFLILGEPLGPSLLAGLALIVGSAFMTLRLGRTGRGGDQAAA